MKKIIPLLSRWILAAGVLLVAGQVMQTHGQNAVPGAAASANQDTAKLKMKWTKMLQGVRRNLQNSNDRESVEFLDKILASLDQPDGLSPAALAANGGRIKKQVGELVRRDALESASSLNSLLWRVFPYANADGPAQPNHRTSGQPGPDGLVLYMPFDAADKDGVVRDASTAGNDGRVYGAKWVTEGRFGGAYQFTLANLTDRIVIPNSDLLNPEYITVAAWIKAADRDGFFNRIVDKDFRYYVLSLRGDAFSKNQRGRFCFETNRGMVESDRVLNDNQWHHVAATFDGKAVRCYIDGDEKGHPVKNPGPLKKNNWDLCIGNSVVDYGTGELLAFDGLIDEVRIYNRALPAAKIKELAAATGAGMTASVPPTAADSAKADPATRMKQLKQLLEQGLISKEDYDRKAKEIIESF